MAEEHRKDASRSRLALTNLPLVPPTPLKATNAWFEPCACDLAGGWCPDVGVCALADADVRAQCGQSGLLGLFDKCLVRLFWPWCVTFSALG